jgi:hypothetical protein
VVVRRLLGQAASRSLTISVRVAQGGRAACVVAGPLLVRAGYAFGLFVTRLVRGGRMACVLAGRVLVRAGRDFQHYEVRVRQSRRTPYVLARWLLGTTGLVLVTIAAILLARGA